MLMSIFSKREPDNVRFGRTARLGLALLGLLLLVAALPASFYALLGVGMGHAHHYHRSAWDGVYEATFIAAPLILLGSGVAALLARNRRWLMAMALLWALLIVDLAAVHFSGKLAATSHGHP